MLAVIDDSPTRNIEEAIHHAYRTTGSKLRNMVTAKRGVDLVETEAGDWIDNFEDIKTDPAEIQVLANAAAFALGRRADQQIIDELSKTTNVVGHGAAAITESQIEKALSLQCAPDFGQSFALIGWKQWSDLINIDGFCQADYIHPDRLPWKGTQAKSWLNTIWIPHSGLELAGNVRRCFLFHQSAVGHDIGDAVTTEVTWHQRREAHFMMNKIDQGATLINESGVVEMPCLEA